jgi:hypothetical protein
MNTPSATPVPAVDIAVQGNPTSENESPVSVAGVESKDMLSKLHIHVAHLVKIAAPPAQFPIKNRSLRRARSWQCLQSTPEKISWRDDMRLLQGTINIDDDLRHRVTVPEAKGKSVYKSPRQLVRETSPNSMQERLELHQTSAVKDRDVMATMTMERSVVFQEADRCSQCDFQFTMLNRRHHCRMCGLSFCSAHSKVYQVRKSNLSMWDISTHESRRLCKNCISVGRQVARRVIADDTFSTWKAIPELGELEGELFLANDTEGFNEVLSKYENVLMNIPLALPVYDRRQQDKDIKREHIKFNGVSYVGQDLLDRFVDGIENAVLGFGRDIEEVGGNQFTSPVFPPIFSHIHPHTRAYVRAFSTPILTHLISHTHSRTCTLAPLLP